MRLCTIALYPILLSGHFRQKIPLFLEKIAASARMLYATNIMITVPVGKSRMRLSPAHPSYADVALIPGKVRNLLDVFAQYLSPSFPDQRKEDYFTLHEHQQILGFASFWDGRWKSGEKDRERITLAFVDPGYEAHQNLQEWLEQELNKYTGRKSEERLRSYGE